MKSIKKKECRICKKTKKTSAFNKKTSSRDGFEARCRICDKQKRLDKKLLKTSKRDDFNNLVGLTFNHWTILEFDKFAGGRAYWFCQCDCKEKTIKSLVGSSVSLGKSKSCGCVRFIKGSEHQAWNPYLSDIEREKNNTRHSIPEYKIWRKEVFKRDNYTCRMSGERHKICVHHLESWANNSDLRYDVYNGITISEKIHKLFHSIYGKSNNTKIQFDEFIKKYSHFKANHFDYSIVVDGIKNKRRIKNTKKLLVKLNFN